MLDALVPAPFRLPSIVTADADEAAAFMDDAVRRGLEGVMVKDLASPYAAGRRGGSWRKVKPVHTFDLVVLAAEWGHGRRQGWLSNLHLGARGDDGFVMVGKTFKGMTDELLRWQTEELQKIAIATEREGPTRRPRAPGEGRRGGHRRGAALAAISRRRRPALRPRAALPARQVRRRRRPHRVAPSAAVVD